MLGRAATILALFVILPSFCGTLKSHLQCQVRIAYLVTTYLMKILSEAIGIKLMGSLLSSIAFSFFL